MHYYWTEFWNGSEIGTGGTITVSGRLLKAKNPAIKVAAVGFEGTHNWDHKGRTSILEIIVSHSQDGLNTLQLTYYENCGRPRVSAVAGSPNFPGGIFNVVEFGSGHECVREVEGLYSTGSGGRNIKKLSIHTNKAVYKVFEAEGLTLTNAECKKFSFKFLGLITFGGFHGTHNNDGEMTSIGVYYNDLGATTTASTVEIDLVHGSTSN